MQAYRRKKISSVERQLRQEAGFGCARCGHPWLEYHHIVPFAEEKHFRPKDMIALCANCHRAIAKLSREKQYQIKENPYNIRKGRSKGSLVFDRPDGVFKIGGIRYHNPQTIIRFHNLDILSIRFKNYEPLISLKLFDEDFWPIFAVIDNEIDLRIDEFWDYEYKFHKVVLRSAPRKIVLKIDFRGEDAIIEGRINLLGKMVDLNRDFTDTGGVVAYIKDMHMSGNSCAIQIGDENTLICPPNFAQLSPKVTFHHK